MKLFSRNKKDTSKGDVIGMVGGAATVATETEQDRILRELTGNAGNAPADVVTEALADIESPSIEPATAGESEADKTARIATEKAAKAAEKASAKAAAKAKREADAAAKKAQKEADAKMKAEAKAAKKAEREAAKAAKPKVVHFGSDKVGRIKATLGDKLGDYTVLTMQDAMLTGDELVAKQAETMTTIGSLGSKVQNRAAFLFDFVSGKKATLNEVLSRTLKVLARDGKIVTGDRGNLHADLLSKPYGASTARATGNNTVNLFKAMKLIVPGTEKQTFVANPDSLLLPKANALLGL